MNFLREFQTDIMLMFSSICGIIAFFVYLQKAMSKSRKRALIFLEVTSMLLLFSDRLAYFYRGDISVLGYWMVRISNFLLFFLVILVLYAFNVYLIDLYRTDGRLSVIPMRLRMVEIFVILGEGLLILSQFTGLYYTFDESNRYQRSSGFLLAYGIPVFILTFQFSVILQYYKVLSRRLRIPLVLFTVIPMAASIVQIFSYGLSLINMSIVGMAILLYVFVLLDMNETVERANQLEIEYLKKEQKTIRRLFEQTATALVNAIDAKDAYTQGHSSRVAGYSREIARLSGKSEDECDRVFYAALLHDVGKIGIVDSIINKSDKLTDEEYELVKQHPLIGNRILSEIREFPYLSIGAHYHHERYDGTGYPEKLMGEEIPEIARIISVADAYDTMTSKRSYRDPLPQPVVREEIVKGSGSQFDPKFAAIMLEMIDADSNYQMKENPDGREALWKNEFHCEEYRSSISYGIPITEKAIRIRFKSTPDGMAQDAFSMPSIILFDSLDGCVHDTVKTLENTRYLEYGELWFTGHVVCTSARNIQVNFLEEELSVPEQTYEIEAVKCGDHVRVVLCSVKKKVEVILALPDSSRYVYISLTGEHCQIRHIELHRLGEKVKEGEITRIADKIDYTSRLESDLPNLQIDGKRTVATEGIPVSNGMQLMFHTMSLPASHLVWHCPYLVLFTSEDGKVYGKNYHEYALVRLDGEKQDNTEEAENELVTEQTEEFEGWEAWKDIHKKGLECLVKFHKGRNQVGIVTENAGIFIKNTTTVKEMPDEIYVAITGDMCVITDIRIRKTTFQ